MSFLVATTFVIGSGWIFLWWWVLEFSQGGLTRYSAWKTLTLSQWVLFLGSFLWLISVLGLFIIFKG